jgi:hypothetical protein
MSQDPDTKDFIFIFHENYFEGNSKYCEKCGEEYTDEKSKWCKPCHIIHLKNKFTNWTSGNEIIDYFILKNQLYGPLDTVFEWVPYNQLNDIKKIGNGVATAIWKDEDGLLNNNKRGLNEKVVLEYLHSSQNITDEMLNEV